MQTSLYADVHIEKFYLIDKEDAYTAHTIYEHRDQFTTLTKNKSAFGFLPHTVWIYLKVLNNTKEPVSNVVEFPYPLLDYVEVLQYKKGTLTEHYITGDMTDFDTRKEDSNTFVIPYTVEANSTTELMIGIRSKGALNLLMSFMSKEEYVAYAKNYAMLLGFYYGAVVIMLIYNLILYFIIKERVYLYYVLFHFVYLFFQLTLNGLSFKYFWPHNPEINEYFFVFMIISNYFAILFSISFLELKIYHPKLFRYFKGFMIFLIILLVLNFMLPYTMMAKIVTFFSLITLVSLFLSGIYMLFKDKTASAKFFVVAWSFSLLGVLIVEISFLGFLPVNMFILYGHQVGAFIELSLLSIALAYKYNNLFVKLMRKEAELRVFNEELEEIIEERTHTIKETNIQLSKEISQKNILHKELFHRVKNNLQMISGILHMHTKNVEDKTAQNVLKHSIQTITSMGMIHEKLYSSDNLEFIDFRQYLFELIEYIKDSLPQQDISFEVQCEDIVLTLKTAIPLGLIVNEIISNSFKHAYDSEKEVETKIITICVHRKSKDNVILHISDNGRGMQASQIKKSFGFKLIESLVTFQLEGSMEFESINGFSYMIEFEDRLEIIEPRDLHNHMRKYEK